MIKIGIIINPIAGMGGIVGLKGTDGEETLNKAIELGSTPKSESMAKKALKELLPLKKDIIIITADSNMGEDIAKDLGFEVKVVYKRNSENTTSFDTKSACSKMLKEGLDLLLFSGGDGTARDISSVVDLDMVCLGIPAGVKIHSPVYAINPKSAGKIAYKYITGNIKHVNEQEVVDIDEEDYRKGRVNTRLYGYLKVPKETVLIQNRKAPTPLSEESAQQAIGLYIVDNMQDDVAYIIGPGTTTKSIMDILNTQNTLLGVDIVINKKIYKLDANCEDILNVVRNMKSKLIITPTGGQGYLLGRGNQQISAEVIKHIGKENIIPILTKQKLLNLKFKPLYVDTFDDDVNTLLDGYMRIVVGYNEQIMYAIKS